MPLVSVVLPSNDLGPFFVRAVASLLSEQDLEIEVIVVLDGVGPPLGAAAEVLADPRIVLLSLSKAVGTPSALNEGWRAARGAFIARLDSDDVSLPERLTKQYVYLHTHPRVGMVSSAAFLVDCEGRRLGIISTVSPGTDVTSVLLRRNCLVHSSVMLRRSLLESLGGYNERCLRKQDYELWLRAARQSVIHSMPEPLVEYRLHPQQNSRRRPPVASLSAVTQARLALAMELGLPRRTAYRHAAWWLLGQLSLYSGLRRPGFEILTGDGDSASRRWVERHRLLGKILHLCGSMKGRRVRQSKARGLVRKIYKRGGIERLRLGLQSRLLKRRDCAIETSRGKRIFVDPHDRRGQLLSLRHGELDSEAIDLWRRLVEQVRPSVALDIGANYGEVAFSLTYPPNLRELHLIEPNPAVLKYLSQTLIQQAHGVALVRLHRGAASDTAETRPLSVSSYSGHASLEQASDCTVEVSTFRIDEVISVTPNDVVLFKIDVEGHEQAALKGMAKLLDTAPAIGICEVIHADDSTADFLCKQFRVSLLAGRTEVEVDAADLLRALAIRRSSGRWPYGKDAVLRSRLM